MKNGFNVPVARYSRRKLLGRGAMLAGAPAFLGAPQSASAAPVTVGKLEIGSGIYQSIGVRPFINCRGTLTVISGSLELAEVRQAKDAAAQHFVQLDELMEAVGQRLAELTGAEWGMVSAGCAAGLAHATTACITGGNPDLHVRVPDLTGFAKDEVVIPKNSRNEYDQAIRSVGVRVIEAGDAAEYEAALGPKVAMVLYHGGSKAGEWAAVLRCRLRHRQKEECSRPGRASPTSPPRPASRQSLPCRLSSWGRGHGAARSPPRPP